MVHLICTIIFSVMMAESRAVAKQALKKLEDQLTCAICLDVFKDPKLLQCFHVYCKDCLQRLVVTDRQGQLSLRCPTCRQSTLLPPATNVSDLQPAFHIHHLFEIQDALEKVKAPKKVLCTKCNKNRPATSYCRDCGKYTCATCTAIHSDWDDFAEHEVVALEQLESKVKQLDSLKKVTLYCSLHKGKELELYCETCEELICHNCTVKKHKDHQYDLVDDTFEKHKAEMVASLDPVENQLGVVVKALEQIEQQSADVNDQRVATKAEIQKIVLQLHEMLEARKTELMGKVDEYADQKVKNLAAQKDEVETVQTQLVSCLSFVRESLRTGSQGEVMKIKKTVMKQIKEMTDNFKPDMLSPCELAYIEFIPSPKLAQACWQFGDVRVNPVSPKKCYATGKGIMVAELGEKVTVVLHTVDDKEKACTKPAETIMSELVSVADETKMACSIKAIEASKYEIGYQPSSRGRHQLHIKVEGEHIKGSPFTVTVKLPVQKLGTPVRVISGLNSPWGVAVNQRGEIIVAESSSHRISIFSRTGERLRSFGSQGSGQGQFSSPRGVAVDDDGNILVAEASNNHSIQKFTSDGTFVAAVDKGTIDISSSFDISIHPDNMRIIVSDFGNNCIQILNSDLTFNSSFGGHGNKGGQTTYPWAVAFDSTGNIYQGGQSSTCVQVFNADGQFLRRFGCQGSGQGELNYPSGIAIDSDDVVYVADYYNDRVSIFTTKGAFLTAFGNKGNGQGQFSTPIGIAVDKDGFVYVCDYHNGRLQVF